MIDSEHRPPNIPIVIRWGVDMSTALLTAPRNPSTTTHERTRPSGPSRSSRALRPAAPRRRCESSAEAAPADFGEFPTGLSRTVSATTLDVDGEVRAMVRPRVPNYALRRVVVGGAVAVALVFGLAVSVGVLAGFSGATASAAADASADIVPAPTVHVAQPGDTLWSIAGEYRGDVDRSRYIDALIGLNGGTDVQAGAAVWLP